MRVRQPAPLHHYLTLPAGREGVTEGRAPVQDLAASAPAKNAARSQQHPQVTADPTGRQAGESRELRSGAWLVEKPQDAGAVRANEAGQAVCAGPRSPGVGECAGHGVDERVPVRAGTARSPAGCLRRRPPG
jgi:hypothetical protein